MAPKAKGDVLQQKSPAEFFADNRTIAGFDNVSRRASPPPGGPLLEMRTPRSRVCRPCLPCPLLALQPGKCLYTTIRELVENSLDAAESISQLPDVDITV